MAEGIVNTSPIFQYMQNFAGVNFITSPQAMETVWRFPKSENRSRRMYKKLSRRFGEQSFQRPCAYVMDGKVYAHPEVIRAVKEMVK